MTHVFNPKAEPIHRAEDARIQLDVQNAGDLSDRDYSSATVSVTFTPDEGTAKTIVGVLTATPTAGPQAYVDIADTTFPTADYRANQSVQAVVTVTLSDASIDKFRFTFELLE